MKFLLFLLAPIALAATDDFEALPWKAGPFKPLETVHWSGKVASTGKPFSAYMATTQDNSLFSFVLPEKGCQIRHETSATAKMFGCQAATNAGYFNFSGWCTANTIIDGQVLTWEKPNRVNFAIIPENQTALIGYIEDPKTFNFSSLVSGFGWLLRNGKVYVDESREIPNP
jgi:hypothetical protein